MEQPSPFDRDRCKQQWHKILMEGSFLKSFNISINGCSFRLITWLVPSSVFCSVHSRYDKGGDYSCKIRWTLFCSPTSFCTARYNTTSPHCAASSCPITQMRAVETLENEDGVIFLLDLKDGSFHVVLLTFTRTTVWAFSNMFLDILFHTIHKTFCMIKRGRPGDAPSYDNCCVSCVISFRLHWYCICDSWDMILLILLIL